MRSMSSCKSYVPKPGIVVVQLLQARMVVAFFSWAFNHFAINAGRVWLTRLTVVMIVHVEQTSCGLNCATYQSQVLFIGSCRPLFVMEGYYLFVPLGVRARVTYFLGAARQGWNSCAICAIERQTCSPVSSCA